MLPILSILAEGITYISLSIATIIITISSVRLGFTYMRKYRSTAFLITLLVCLAACSGGHTGQLNQRPPKPLPLPLLHICRQPTYQTQPLIQPTTQLQAPILSPRRSTQLRHYAFTALKLAPLLFLEPYQLVIPALTLMPTTPPSLNLMAISQLPHVMAASESASSSLAAAETLSTLVASAWAKYVAR
jgi:hypothetical protein